VNEGFRAIEQIETLKPNVIIFGNGQQGEEKMPAEIQLLSRRSGLCLNLPNYP
jgi:hypothetical protein